MTSGKSIKCSRNRRHSIPTPVAYLLVYRGVDPVLEYLNVVCPVCFKLTYVGIRHYITRKTIIFRDIGATGDFDNLHQLWDHARNYKRAQEAMAFLGIEKEAQRNARG